jgi:acyl carrier protein
MTEAQVLAEIQKIAAAQLDFTGELEPGHELIRDLDLDSLALITLAVALEDRFQISLLGEEADRPRTVADLCRLVLRQMKAAS